MQTKTVQLLVNGVPHRLTIDSRATLADTLRDKLHLTGTKIGCDRGECGACTVHVNNRRVLGCMTFTVLADGCNVTTIEGISPDPSRLHALQQAFIECDAMQCGFCTPGQIMSALGCIAEGQAGSVDEVRQSMCGNLCRCGAYPNVVEAVLRYVRSKWNT